jgi:hypothetical protein
VPERLLGALAEAEVEGAREVLAPAVEPARGEQLLGAHGAERLAELVADEVLPAVAAGEREVRRLDVAPAGEPGDEPRVLVVGVRADDEDAGRRREPVDQLGEGGGAARRLGGALGARRRGA